VQGLPIFGVGHSMGALMHMIIGSRYALQREAGAYTRSLSAQLEPCLTHKNTIHTLNSLSYPLNTGYTILTRIPYPMKSAQVELSSERM